MADENNNVKEETSEHQEITSEEIAANLKDITECNVAVWRKNKEGAMVTVPVEKLEQYLGGKAGDAKFQIEKEWKGKIKLAREPKTAEPPKKEVNPMKEMEKFGNVEEQKSRFGMMSVVEREEILDSSLEKLHALEGDGQKFDLPAVSKMVETIANSFYANNANLEDNVSTENLKDNLFGVFQKTNWIIQMLINLFENNNYNYHDYKVIDEISTGSITLDHINKVLLNFVTFCIYFNEFIDKGLVTKNIRGEFREKYLPFYTKKMPGKNISIEVVFKNGIRRLEKETELLNYSAGALMYDMGKIPDINFHDGEGEYDEGRVKKHALTGYNMVTNAQMYPFEVAAMSAFHHEYYGGNNSYNFTKPLMSRITGVKRDEEEIKYFITFEVEDFKDGTSLSFFPCKVIEVIDVFDALVGKKKKSAFDALLYMKSEFIIRDLKIDPIIFRIFIGFKLKCGVIEVKEFQEVNEMKQPLK